MGYLLLNVPFHDWIPFLLKSGVSNVDDHKSKIINFTSSDNPRNLFQTAQTSIDILNIVFAIFMMANFKENIPETYYYSFNEYSFEEYSDFSQKMILKPAIGYAGNGIKIITVIEKLPSVVISKYISHEIYYSGHFLVNKGQIIKKLYFQAETKDPNFIARGGIRGYTVVEVLNDDIFENIFISLEYSGFVCVDFTIKNTNIIIFEINPRLGGSLVHSEIFLPQFIAMLE